MIEWRFAQGQYERFADVAAQMVQPKVDAVLLGTMGALRATQNASSTIPTKNSAIVSDGKTSIDLLPLEARNTQEVESAFSALAKDRSRAVIVVPDAVTMSNRRRDTELALRDRLAIVFSQSAYTDAGGLKRCGENLREFVQHVATNVDKILKGARTIGIEIARRVLLQADEVLE